MKYKPCCGRRCLLGGCPTSETGGCYCVCRLKDWEGTLISLLEGCSYKVGPGVVYVPGRNIPPSEEDKEKYTKELEECREMLKKYEIDGNQV